MRAFIPALVALAATPSLASAEEAKPNPAQAEIKRLVGKWSGKGTITAEGQTHAVTMTWNCTDAAAGAKCHGKIVGLPGFTYELDDLWGYSAVDGLVHWYTVTNAGEVHDHAGHLDADGGLLSVQLPTDGKLFEETITFTRKKKSLVVAWETTLGTTVREAGRIELMRK
jgi:hypothetical protein